MEQITEISIKEISLSGFRNQKEPVSFALGDVNCVTGHNGTGKTTLAHAVAFAFYGVTYFGEQKAKQTFEQFKKDDTERLSAELDELRRTVDDSPEIMQREIEEIDMLLSRGLLSDEEFSELESEERSLAGLEAQIKKLREYSVDSQISALNEQAAAFENDKRRYTEILASLEEYVSKRTELLAEELKMPNVSITLFEPVKTTGELKSVFRFAYKGRNYAALSLSGRTVAGLEICALMRRLTGLNFPVFIDNTESVAHFDMSSLTCQTVFLRMVKNAPLSVKSMNQATEPLKKAS